MGNNFSKSSSHNQDKPSNSDLIIPEHTLNTTWGTFKWKGCQENPGHKEFIPVKEFNLEHLPKGYRTDHFLRSIRLLGDLTCRITVTSVSDKRPHDNTLFSQSGRVRMGTGTVFEVIRETNETEAKTCVQCGSLHETTGFCIIRIITACHVVFDCQEAGHTTIDLFYDDEFNKKDIHTLDGCRVISKDVDEDWCVFDCLTGDDDLAKRMHERLNDFKSLIHNRKLDTSVPWIIVASHPHGLAKHITVGEWKEYDGTESTKQVTNIDKRNFMKFYEDSVEYSLIPSIEPSIVSNTKNAEIVGVECKVFLPDGTDQICQIWQFDSPVKKTKDILMAEACLGGNPDDFYLELMLPNEEKQVMNEEQDLNYYMDDLTKAYSIYIRRNEANLIDCS
ncbi:unnamed protein product [Lymnaea stagnalis]|uniref:Uncharacterized protein n=1 Tax=Lymnaea stagnalis TaxID=6523 RepID=A0AAV2I7Y1_LYMST